MEGHRSPGGRVGWDGSVQALHKAAGLGETGRQEEMSAAFTAGIIPPPSTSRVTVLPERPQWSPRPSLWGSCWPFCPMAHPLPSPPS